VLARRHLRGVCFYCGCGGHWARTCAVGWVGEEATPVGGEATPPPPRRETRRSAPPRRQHNPAAYKARPRGVYWDKGNRQPPSWRFAVRRSASKRAVSVSVRIGKSTSGGWQVELPTGLCRVAVVSALFDSEAQAAEAAGALAVEISQAYGNAPRRRYHFGQGPQN